MTERNQAIVNRYLAGESLQVIADDLGISRQRAHQIAKNADDYRPRPPWRLAKVGGTVWLRQQRAAGLLPLRQPRQGSLRIIAMRESGATYQQIIADVGVCESTVIRCLERWRPDLRGDYRPRRRNTLPRTPDTKTPPLTDGAGQD